MPHDAHWGVHWPPVGGYITTLYIAHIAEAEFANDSGIFWLILCFYTVCCGLPLLLEYLLEFNALHLDLALAIVIEYLLVGRTIELCIQFFGIIFGTIVLVLLAGAHERPIPLHMSIGAGASRRRQTNTIVHEVELAELASPCRCSLTYSQCALNVSFIFYLHSSVLNVSQKTAAATPPNVFSIVYAQYGQMLRKY